MRTFKANNPNIIYIGSRDNHDSVKIAKFNYCKCFILFKGTAHKLNAEGDVLCSLDGGCETAKKELPTVTTDAAALQVAQTENSVEIKVNDGMIFRPYFEFGNETDFNCYPIFDNPL